MDPTQNQDPAPGADPTPANNLPTAQDPPPAGDDPAQGDDPNQPGSAPAGDGGEGGEGADPAGAGGSSDDPDGSGEGGPRKRSEDRIREIVAERNAAMEWGRYWYEQARALRGSGEPGAAGQPAQGAQPGAGGASDDPGPAPKLEDFESSEKWSQAFQEWTQKTIAATVAKRTTETLEQRTAAEARDRAVASFNAGVEKLAKVKPDVYQVLGNPNLPVTKTMTEVALASERGPELMYHLGQNPVEAARIARMSPAQQAAALGRLEAKLPPLAGGGASGGGQGAGAGQGGKPPPRKQPSNAPAPPNPIDGAGAASVDLENCSLKEFLDRRLGRRRSSAKA